MTFSLGAGLRDDELRFLSDPEPRILQADIDAERARRIRDGWL